MLTKANNERLTRVVGEKPMGRLMRKHVWIPFARAEAVGGTAPERVRLFGEDYVVFRAQDGRIGFVDERCPHRGVSLALARIEGCALRCIFHGWKIDASGTVVEVPTEGDRSGEVAAKVQTNHYPTREAGGIAWVYLGGGDPPPFPALPFLQVPSENVWVSRSIVPCNWLQGLEGALDSSHLGWLHKSWIEGVSSTEADKFLVPPTYDTRRTVYGLRAAAVRDLPDGSSFLRVGEYVLPFTVMNQTDRKPERGREYACFMAVPVDDESHLLFWLIWNDSAPLGDVSSFTKRDFDDNDYATFDGDRDTNWGQDRAAMDAGHFSGFTENLIAEDVVVQISMGRIADRTREHLGSTDQAIVKARMQLLKLVKAFEAGEPLQDVLGGYDTEGRLPVAMVVPQGFDWASETGGAPA